MHKRQIWDQWLPEQEHQITSPGAYRLEVLVPTICTFPASLRNHNDNIQRQQRGILLLLRRFPQRLGFSYR